MIPMLNEPHPVKLIAFSIADYCFALPMEQVLRVVNYPDQASNSLQSLGLVQIGRHLVKVLDLHQPFSRNNSIQPATQPAGYLSGGVSPDQPISNQPISNQPISNQPISNQSPSEQPRFLLILASPHGELYGIPIDRPPDVIECVPSQVQRLPQSHPPSHAIERFSRAAITSATITASESPGTRSDSPIFLLDLQHLFSAIVPDTPALKPASHPQ
jgi:chemotaxis signal transduction protein